MKVIEVIVRGDGIAIVDAIAKEKGALDQWHLGPSGNEDRQAIRLLVDDQHRQEVMDALQNSLPMEKTRIVVLPVEASLPQEGLESSEQEGGGIGCATREELYYVLAKDAELSSNYLLLVFLSTIVSAIGLIENNVAVVIGAMVIAPLLSPNLALALAATLGDGPLMRTALKTNLSGMALALGLSFAIGVVLPIDLDSQELLSRTEVGLDSIVLALASGSAAALSFTTGLSSVLVGVMVAVALMPPTATLALMLASGQVELAFGSALLLAANVVCVNLAAAMVFLFRGLKPRTWLEKRKAKQSVKYSIAFWGFLLFVLLIAIYLRAYVVLK